MQREKVENLLKEKFPINHDLIVPLLRGTIRIETTTTKGNELSQSKFGGFPDLPESVDWPHSFDDVPLSFFAQINLEEIKIENNLLPNSGMLYFFVLTMGVIHRFPEEKGESKVIYSNTSKLSENTFDGLQIDPFKSVPISFFQDYTLPNVMDDCYSENTFNDEEIELIEEMNYYHFKNPVDDEQIIHHMLGWPYTIQNPVNLLFALKYFNLNLDVLYDELFAKKMLEESRNFRVLLQIGFEEEETDFSRFGGDGMVYFGIHLDDLKNQNFDKVVAVFQNT